MGGMVRVRASISMRGRELGFKTYSSAVIGMVAMIYRAKLLVGNLKGTLLLAIFTL